MNNITFVALSIIIISNFGNADYLANQGEAHDSLMISEFTIPDQDQLFVGFSYTTGNMIPHAKEVLNVMGKNPKAYELLLLWHLNNKKVWDDCNCYPRLGLYFGYYDYEYEEILGHGYSGGINFEYFFGLPNKYNFFIQSKAGLSYLTKPHDEINNPLNMSYSTHLNYLLSVGGGMNIRIADPVTLKFDLSMNHKSNAALTEPNGGINYTAFSVAALYALNDGYFYERNHYDPYLNGERKTRWDLTYSYGISAMPYPQKGQVPMYGISFSRSMQVLRFTAITLGFEFEHNGRAVEITKRKNPAEFVNPLRVSGLSGVDFLMGSAIFSVQVGGYLSRPFKEKDDFYQRWGLMYKVIDHVYLGINFKSYRNYADHLSLRMAYSFY